MSKPHLARLAENTWNNLSGRFLRSRGWRPLIVPHVGYGGPGFVRVFARVLLTPADWEPEETAGRRGWRNFLTSELPGAAVTVTVDGAAHQVGCDASGNLDARLPAPGLAPGWAEVRLSTPNAEPVSAPVLVVSGAETFGLVSDIDDTVLRTSLPRPLVAAYRTFVQTESARRPVPGMAGMYARVLAEHPGAPTVYVSTGAWNTAPMLRRFLSRHGFPAGPLLLTDWGPTNTGWFRSGQDHKRACLARLAEDFPSICWLLVGDDGQHDPSLYGEFARSRPERVRAIAIRQLNPGEQVLAHGTSGTRTGEGEGEEVLPVPEVRGPDGDALAEALRRVL